MAGKGGRNFGDEPRHLVLDLRVRLIGPERFQTSGPATSDLASSFISASWRDSDQDEDALIGCTLHQHKLHLSEVYGLRRDQPGRVFL